MSLHATLREQLEWWWDNLFWPRMQGLTDDEYFWEPVDGCWTIRQGDDGRWNYDLEWPPPDPAPVTTIGWRLGHMGGGLFYARVNTFFGGTDEILMPGSAAEALEWLERGHQLWNAGVDSLGGDEGLEQKLGERGGPFAESSYGDLVAHINREVFHHGAEVCLLRDLYRAGLQRKQGR